MKISPRSMRIGAATLVAAFMIAAGYVLPGISAPQTKSVNAELTDELLASYVAKDTDADGLPDWQETLYGTDISKADTDNDGISDGDAVRQGLLTPNALASQIPQDPIGEEEIPGDPAAPGSLTDQFGRAFFEAYVAASNGQPLTAEAQEALVTKLLGEFTASAAQSLNSSYTLVSLNTDPSATVSSYAGNVERILDTEIPDNPDSDMAALAERVITNDDGAAATRLAELGVQYTSATRALLAVSVPTSLAQNHLRLVQGLDQAGRAATALSNYEKDPLLTMGALSVLIPARTTIMEGFTGIAEAVVVSGAPAAGAPGALIVDLVRREQQTP